jgi:hypothetical protein
MPLTAKVFNRTKRLILGSFQMCPSNFHSNAFPARRPLSFAPKTSFFVLKLQMRKNSGVATKAVVGEADACDFSGSDPAGHVMISSMPTAVLTSSTAASTPLTPKTLVTFSS